MNKPKIILLFLLGLIGEYVSIKTIDGVATIFSCWCMAYGFFGAGLEIGYSFKNYR